MESKNKSSKIEENEEEKVIKSLSELKLNHPKIDLCTLKYKKYLGELTGKYSKSKDIFLSQRKEIHRITSILIREKKQEISREEYIKIYGCRKKIITEVDMNFYLPKDKEKIKELSAYSVQNIERLNMSIENQYEKEYKDFKQFMLSLNRTKLDEFIFNVYPSLNALVFSSMKDKISISKVYHISPYFLELRDVVSRTTSKITLHNLLINCSEFSFLIRAARHVEELEFDKCKILTDSEFNLGNMFGCKIKILQINNSITYDNMKEHKHDSMIILETILNCSLLINSLKILKFSCKSTIMFVEFMKKAQDILSKDFCEIKKKLKFYV